MAISEITIDLDQIENEIESPDNMSLDSTNTDGKARPKEKTEGGEARPKQKEEAIEMKSIRKTGAHGSASSRPPPSRSTTVRHLISPGDEPGPRTAHLPRQPAPSANSTISSEPRSLAADPRLELPWTKIWIAVISLAVALFDLISDGRFCMDLTMANGMNEYSLHSWIILGVSTFGGLLTETVAFLYVICLSPQGSLPPGARMLTNAAGVLVEDLPCSILILRIILRCGNCGFVVSMIQQGSTAKLTLIGTLVGSVWRTFMIVVATSDWFEIESPPEPRGSPGVLRKRKLLKMAGSFLAGVLGAFSMVLTVLSLSAIIIMPGMVATISGCSTFVLRLSTKTVYPIGRGGCTTNGSGASIDNYSMEMAIDKTFDGRDVLKSNRMTLTVSCDFLFGYDVLDGAASTSGSRCDLIATAWYSFPDCVPMFRIVIFTDSLIQAPTKPRKNVMLRNSYWTSPAAIERVLRAYCDLDPYMPTYQCRPIIEVASPALPCFNCSRGCYSWTPIDHPTPAIMFHPIEARVIVGNENHSLRWSPSTIYDEYN